jgi:hypothetical protein
MEWAVTITAIVLTAGLTAFSSWKSGRPRKDTARATWISWPLVTVFAAAALFMGVVHAVNLMGFETGRGQVIAR